MHDYLVSCSYDELLHFKRSSARAKYLQICSERRRPTPVEGLVQIIVDNFDANLSGPNGLVSTNDMATIETHLMLLTDHHSHRTMDQQVENVQYVVRSKMGSSHTWYREATTSWYVLPESTRCIHWVVICRDCPKKDSPTLALTEYGWYHLEGSIILFPTIVPQDTPLAPADLLKLNKCGCSSDHSSTNKKCSCKVNALYSATAVGRMIATTKQLPHEQSYCFCC